MVVKERGGCELKLHGYISELLHANFYNSILPPKKNNKTTNKQTKKRATNILLTLTCGNRSLKFKVQSSLNNPNRGKSNYARRDEKKDCFFLCVSMGYIQPILSSMVTIILQASNQLCYIYPTPSIWPNFVSVVSLKGFLKIPWLIPCHSTLLLWKVFALNECSSGDINLSRNPMFLTRIFALIVDHHHIHCTVPWENHHPIH